MEPRLESEYRQFAQRRHRTLGHYLLHVCWETGTDCVKVDRKHLESFLQLNQFREERFNWMKADMAFAFSHIYPVYIDDALWHAFFSRFAPEQLREPSDAVGAYEQKEDWRQQMIHHGISIQDASRFIRMEASPSCCSLDVSMRSCEEPEVLKEMFAKIAGLADGRMYMQSDQSSVGSDS